MAPATDQLSACDPGLHVSGRYVTRPDAGSIVYDWPGVTVAVAVKSAGGEGDAAAPESEVNFDMDGGGNLFSVLQDGRCVNCCVSACFHSYLVILPFDTTLAAFQANRGFENGFGSPLVPNQNSHGIRQGGQRHFSREAYRTPG